MWKVDEKRKAGNAQLFRGFRCHRSGPLRRRMSGDEMREQENGRLFKDVCQRPPRFPVGSAVVEEPREKGTVWGFFGEKEGSNQTQKKGSGEKSRGREVCIGRRMFVFQEG
jgi:hypothetical protein